MGILSFIKKKVQKPKEEVKKPSKKVRVSKEKKPKKKLDREALTAKILLAPIVSEKATALSEENKYVFRVKSEANKHQVKEAVERAYNVTVLKVNIIKKPSKKRRLGRTEGYVSGFKKAVVTLKKGDKIEIFKGV